MNYNWRNLEGTLNKSYRCGYCNKDVGPSNGYISMYDPKRGHQSGNIYICPKCTQPTFFSHTNCQTPSISYGNDVNNISNEQLKKLYNEARACYSVSAFTASALCCRKILMNLAVTFGATAGQTFIKYVEYLESNHYTPPNSNVWVDKIRQKGNEATHELPSISKDDAEKIIHFTEMLLKFNFEFQI